MRRMFRYAVKAFTVEDWISLAITEHAFIFSIGFVQNVPMLIDPIY
jgi:hypothetical protein